MAVRHKHSRGWKIIPPSFEREDKELAAHYVSERFPVVPETWNVGDVHAYITENSADLDAISYIYIVNPRKKLVGVVSIRDIFSHPFKTPLKNIMKRDMITISPETHREKIAALALKHNLHAIPIVKDQKLEGVILTSKILSIINQTLHERLFRFSGIHRNHLEYEDTTQIPLWESTAHRLPWLVIGLGGVFLAAGIITHFEKVLSQHLVIAFFIPAILYMSNALGTQNQILLIRDLAVMGKEFQTGKYVGKTLLIGAILSLIIGGAVYGITFLVWKDVLISYVLSLAMMATLIVSSASSIFTTLGFRALHQDPATGSGPFATIISDITSIAIYFLIVSTLL